MFPVYPKHRKFPSDFIANPRVRYADLDANLVNVSADVGKLERIPPVPPVVQVPAPPLPPNMKQVAPHAVNDPSERIA